MNRAITAFQSLKPTFETPQKQIFEWLVEAHIKADQSCSEQIKKKLHHVGCGDAHIHKRGHEIADFCHLDWDAMEVYRLNENKVGAGLKKRQEVHQSIILKRFEEFFPKDAKAPDHLIHVTCTGYTSPSAAQILVADRGWETTLTSCYHYGCYGSIPAIRLANKRSEIVHTELCTLHFNPLNHDLDQLVGQSLFSDGWIKYTVLPENEAASPYLKLLATREKIIPGSSSLMEWRMTDWGFHFILSKEIPALIAAHLKDFLSSLCDEALISKALFAIHPGGPKIIDNIKTLFNLSEEQVAASREILRLHGNMSSATLPHIWQAICNDPSIPKETPIISLAFGPGLTLAGALLLT